MSQPCNQNQSIAPELHTYLFEAWTGTALLSIRGLRWKFIDITNNSISIENWVFESVIAFSKILPAKNIFGSELVWLSSF